MVNSMTIAPELFLVLFGLALALGAFLLYRLIASEHNELEWADLVATNGKLNAYKIGYWVGVFIGAWAVIKTTYMGDLDALVFAGYLTFLGGVPVGMSAIGRSRYDPNQQQRDLGPPPKGFKEGEG